MTCISFIHCYLNCFEQYRRQDTLLNPIDPIIYEVCLASHFLLQMSNNILCHSSDKFFLFAHCSVTFFFDIVPLFIISIFFIVYTEVLFV